MSTKMRVLVDSNACRLYGVCVAIHPEVFDVPAGSSTLTVLRSVVDGDDLEDVQEAARACPAQALSLQPECD